MIGPSLSIYDWTGSIKAKIWLVVILSFVLKIVTLITYYRSLCAKNLFYVWYIFKIILFYIRNIYLVIF